ncbi:MAG: hypothetical protein QM813_01680 [Verrucomicrobiota bacterium]
MIKTAKQQLPGDDLLPSNIQFGTNRKPCVGLILVQLQMQFRSLGRPSPASVASLGHFTNMTKQSLSWCAALLLGVLTLLNSAVAGTHVWSGAVNAKWSVAGNWASGGVPAFGETAVVLRFPAEGANREITNDVAQLTVQKIELTGNGYRIYGASIHLTNAPSGTNFSVVAGLGGTLDLPIIMPNGTFTAAAGSSGTLEFSGPISGYGALHKLGTGVVKFTGDDGNTFSGGFYLVAGKAYLGKTMGVALPGPVFIGATNEPAVFGQEPNFVVAYLAHNQIADAADIHVWGGASELDLNGYNDTVNDLDLVDGSVTTWSSSFGPDGTCELTVTSRPRRWF